MCLIGQTTSNGGILLQFFVLLLNTKFKLRYACLSGNPIQVVVFDTHTQTLIQTFHFLTTCPLYHVYPTRFFPETYIFLFSSSSSSFLLRSRRRESSEISGNNMVDSVVKKAIGRLNFLYRYSSYLNKSLRKKNLCAALIQCHLDYCCTTFFFSVSTRSRHKLHLAQKKKCALYPEPVSKDTCRLINS